MKLCIKCKKRPRARSHRWCTVCRNAYMREHRTPYSQLSPEAQRRSSCRAYANVYLKRGKIVRESCSCGEPGEEMHHEDYSKPLEIIWKCKECHRKITNEDRDKG